jgi:imidazolonepropionase-like amidohydrolase
MSRRHLRICAICGLRPVTIVALAAALTGGVSASALAQPLAIVGGKVYPVSGPAIENGTVLIENGAIKDVGANVAVPANATRIDAKGKWVTPGLIHAASGLGLVEVGAVPDANDASAKGDRAVAASFRAWDGLNRETVLWDPARNEGVTTVVVAPGGRSLISGQGAIVDLTDGPRADVFRKAPVAMFGQLSSAQGAGTSARGELVQRFRELVADVRAFAARREAYDAGDSRELSARRADLEAMVPVIEGRLPLVLDVNRAADIEMALDLAREFSLRIMILGGSEGWKVASRLAAEKVPVLTGALDNIPSSFATLGSRQENAGLLAKAGVPLVIVGTAGEAFNVRNIRQEAGNAVAYGLGWDAALRAVTLSVAEQFGVADRVGSLQTGRDANVVVWSGDPFEFATIAEHVFVRGRSVRRPSRQDELTEKYKRLVKP